MRPSCGILSISDSTEVRLDCKTYWQIIGSGGDGHEIYATGPVFFSKAYGGAGAVVKNFQ
jgi:hypothetical protein